MHDLQAFVLHSHEPCLSVPQTALLVFMIVIILSAPILSYVALSLSYVSFPAHPYANIHICNESLHSLAHLYTNNQQTHPNHSMQDWQSIAGDWLPYPYTAYISLETSTSITPFREHTVESYHGCPGHRIYWPNCHWWQQTCGLGKMGQMLSCSHTNTINCFSFRFFPCFRCTWFSTGDGMYIQNAFSRWL